MKPIAKRRRWFQFSLRTLLIATLLIGLAAGWLGREIRRAKYQAAAIESLTKHGATIEYASEETTVDISELTRPASWCGNSYMRETRRAWMRDWLGFDLFALATSVKIRIGGRNDDDQLGLKTALLSDLPELQAVTLQARLGSNQIEITSEAIAPIVQLPGLTRLTLAGPEFGEYLWDRTARDGAIRLTDEAWSKLAGASQLESLVLDGVCVNDSVVRHICELPQLRVLVIEGDGSLTDQSISRIDMCKNLERLELDARSMSEQSLGRIALLPSLRTLSWRGNLTVVGFRHLTSMRELTTLQLIGTTETEGKNLILMAELPKLKELNLMLKSVSETRIDALRSKRPDIVINNLARHVYN